MIIISLADDVRTASTWGERVGRVLRGPGWQPTTAPTPQLQEAVA